MSGEIEEVKKSTDVNRNQVETSLRTEKYRNLSQIHFDLIIVIFVHE